VAEPDYYAVLGVSPTSEDIVIQGAYRALMRRYHPDKNPSEAARKRTVEINAAYAVLGDEAKRAAYDVRRKQHDQSSNGSAKSGASTAPPPPPPPPKSETPANGMKDNDAWIVRLKGAAAVIIGLGIVAAFIGMAGNRSLEAANNTMNVDENLTTSDFQATDMNAMNAADMNGAGQNTLAIQSPPPDLSKLPQAVLSYDTIEAAADRVAKLITTKGMLGARAYSENCHKSVEVNPSWNGADGCAAFDYAAAYIDDAVTTQSGWPKDGYFQFQSGNQPDNYAAVGAPPYITSDRLSKIRSAAQDAALAAFRMEIARRNSAGASTLRTSPPVPNTANSNSSD
jgi:hypothetical protein